MFVNNSIQDYQSQLNSPVMNSLEMSVVEEYIQPCALGGRLHEHNYRTDGNTRTVAARIKQVVSCLVNNEVLASSLFWPGEKGGFEIASDESDEELDQIQLHRPLYYSFRQAAIKRDRTTWYACPALLRNNCEESYGTGNMPEYRRHGFWNYSEWTTHLLTRHGFLGLALREDPRRAQHQPLHQAASRMADKGDFKQFFEIDLEYQRTLAWEQIKFNAPLHPARTRPGGRIVHNGYYQGDGIYF